MKSKFYNRRTVFTCTSSAVLLSAMLASQGASAHGHAQYPPSRAYACQQALNNDCGNAQYEPQSVGETFKGFPAGAGGGPLQGPVDGKIASGGNSSFSAMDAQSATRWYKTELKDRSIDFQWRYTAVHPATKHEYFITRKDWNPNQPLTRASFDSAPFCEVDGRGEKPVADTKHHCTIPDDRSGYHVILAVWTVADTDAAFYSVVDVDIQAEAALPGGWSAVGNIASETTLLAGDKVKARAFTGSGESTPYSVEISIDNAEEGKPQAWAFKLAEKINQTHELVRAGVRNDAGDIEPVKGSNTIYAQKESGVVRYEIQQEMQDDIAATLALGAIKPEYVLEKGLVKLDFGVVGNRKMNIEATLFDDKNKATGSLKQTVESGTATLEIDVRSNPGPHTLTLVGTTLDGRTTRQDTQAVTLSGEGAGIEYDFVFPQGLASYKAGTKVLQPKTNEVYECKQWPADGYCKQYSPSANGYEPGVGAHSHAAWDKL